MNQFDQLAAPGYPIFIGSEIEHPLPQDAFFHILPVPYEASVSYGGGTALGPAAILEASWQLETFDGKSNPCDLGIFTHPPVDMSGDAETIVNAITRDTLKILEMGKFPIAIGGEHTVTYGLIKALIAAGEDDFGVVQIDAHADLREQYEGNPYSHACVMKRVVDKGIPIVQLGVRAFSDEERQIREKFGVVHHDADELVPNAISEIKLPENFPKKVFFTLDIDGMDPSIFPSTGTPVPGGLLWYQTLSLFESVAKQREIIGFDIMEFAPIKGFHAYEFSASLLMYKMMGIVQRQLIQRQQTQR